MKKWIPAQIYYKYGVGYMSLSVEDENWRASLRVRNGKNFTTERNIWYIDKLGTNIYVSMHMKKI